MVVWLELDRVVSGLDDCLSGVAVAIILRFCFCQAEDGIRVLVRSRGRGDVYKRQTYALLNVPSQTFHLFTALGSVASTIAGTAYGRTSAVYYAIGAALVVSVAPLVLGGLKLSLIHI